MRWQCWVFWDPLGFCESITELEFKSFRSCEITYWGLAMMAKMKLEAKTKSIDPATKFEAKTENIDPAKVEAATENIDPTKPEAKAVTATSSGASVGEDPIDKFMCWGECQGRCNFCKEFSAVLAKIPWPAGFAPPTGSSGSSSSFPTQRIRSRSCGRRT